MILMANLGWTWITITAGFLDLGVGSRLNNGNQVAVFRPQHHFAAITLVINDGNNIHILLPKIQLFYSVMVVFDVGEYT